MLYVVNWDISLNRGESINLQLISNDSFKIGDIIKFSIVEPGNYDNVIFVKEFEVPNDSDNFTITLTSDDTRKICEPFKDGEKLYYYEIELNDEFTLLGKDRYGDKKFILYPEAGGRK